jgi:hypothetical protein
MATTPPITIATSLAPGRKDKVQADALASWRQVGFEIISVNAEREIAALKDDFADVVFIAAPRTGEKVAGKPVPMIVDMLRAARQAGGKLVGVINADIVLRPVPGLVDVLAQNTTGSLVMLPRVDVSDTADFRPKGDEKFSVGYDGFFIDAGLVDQIPDSPFCLGMPFWDYWLPMIALLKDWPLKTIAAPVALHAQHDTKWDQAIYFYFHALASDLAVVCRESATLKQDPSLALLADVFANVYGQIFARGTAASASEDRREMLADLFDRIQEAVVHHIKQRAQPLTVPGA